MHWPDIVFSTGQASTETLVLGGRVQPVHSPSTRGLVVVLGSDGDVRIEALQGDLRAVAGVDEDVVLSGPYLNDENRGVVRRLGPDGASQWTDGALWWTATPVAIWPQGTATWAISKDGTAVLHDADGVRVQSVPCLGAVDGVLLQVAVGPKPALAFGLHPVGGERPWWVLAGSPTEPPRGWASADSIGAMAWTPRGSLLVAIDGAPQLMEVAL